MNALPVPRFLTPARACDCKPGHCKEHDARDCPDWVKAGTKRKTASAPNSANLGRKQQ